MKALLLGEQPRFMTLIIWQGKRPDTGFELLRSVSFNNKAVNERNGKLTPCSKEANRRSLQRKQQ